MLLSIVRFHNSSSLSKVTGRNIKGRGNNACGKGNNAWNTLNIRAFLDGRERRRRRSNATCGHESDSVIVFSVMSLSTFFDRSRFLYTTTCILIDALRVCERGGRRRERQKNHILRCISTHVYICHAKHQTEFRNLVETTWMDHSKAKRIKRPIDKPDNMEELLSATLSYCSRSQFHFRVKSYG